MDPVIELEKESGDGTEKVVFEGPIVGEPSPRIVVLIELRNQKTCVGIVQQI